jgi:hypothetical protein
MLPPEQLTEDALKKGKTSKKAIKPRKAEVVQKDDKKKQPKGALIKSIKNGNKDKQEKKSSTK